MLRGRSAAATKLLERLESLLESGIDMNKALEIISGSSDKTLSHLAKRCLKYTSAGGRSFTEAIKPYVNSGEYALLRAGEETGNLPYVIEKIKELRQLKSKAIGGLLGAITYPFFVLMLFFGMLYFVSSQAVENIVRGFGEEVKTPLLELMLFISKPAFIFTFFTFLALLIGTTLFVMLKVHRPFRARLDRFFPFSVYRFYQGVVFLYVYSVLLKNGYREEQTLELISRLSGYYKLIFPEVLKHIRAGRGIGDALKRSGYLIPDEETVDLLRSIQGTGTVFQERLPRVAERKIKEAAEKISKANKVVNTVALLVVGVLMMIYVSGFMGMVQGMMQKLLSVKGF